MASLLFKLFAFSRLQFFVAILETIGNGLSRIVDSYRDAIGFVFSPIIRTKTQKNNANFPLHNLIAFMPQFYYLDFARTKVKPRFPSI
jgi:hypothetical protein